MSEKSLDQFEDGDEPRTAHSAKDVLVGDRFGQEYSDGIGNAAKDVLVGDRFGQEYSDGIGNAAKDVLVGDRFGEDYSDAIANASIDFLIKEPPFYAAHAAKDVLLDLPNDPVTVRSKLAAHSAIVAQVLDTVDPDTIRSTSTLLQFSQIIAQVRPGVFPRSVSSLYSVQQLAAAKADFLSPYFLRSRSRLPSFRQLVAQSRVHDNPPVSEIVAHVFTQLAVASVAYPVHQTPAQSGNFFELVARRRTLVPQEPEWHAQTTVQAVVGARTPAPDPRSVSTYMAARQLVVAKRIIASNWFTAQVIQVSAQKSSSEFPISPTSFASGHQLAVIAAMRPAPMSPTSVSSVKQLVAAQLDLSGRKSENNVAAMIQQVVRAFAATTPMSPTSASAFVGVVAQRSVSPIPISQNIIGQFRQLVPRHRVTQPTQRSHSIIAVMRVQYAIADPNRPMYETDREVSQFVRLSASHRNVPPPAANSGMYAATMHQLSARVLGTEFPGDVVSQEIVGSISQITAAKRNTQPPEDVTDPTIGRHAAQFISLAAAKRDTLTPDELAAMRVVSSIGVAVVVADIEFIPPEPNPPVTGDAIIPGLFAAALVADNQFGIAIEATVTQFVGAAAVFDASLTFDPSVPTTPVSVPLVVANATLADNTFENPNQVTAELDVSWLVGAVAAKQTGLPDPSIPVSELRIDVVSGAAAVSEDGVWPDPSIPVSRLDVFDVQSAALVDETDFDDPYRPTSDLDVLGVAAAATVGDEFVDPNIPVSDVDTFAVAAAVGLDDTTLPDPNIPVSSVDTYLVAAAVGLDDDSMPDPMLPSSDVSVSLTLASLAARDDSMDGITIGSELKFSAVHIGLLLKDPSMFGIPPRAAEARPVISIRIW